MNKTFLSMASSHSLRTYNIKVATLQMIIISVIITYTLMWLESSEAVQYTLCVAVSGGFLQQEQITA